MADTLLDVIIFKKPLSEMLEAEKNRSIKMLLDTLDIVIAENTPAKAKLRKQILDEINGAFRMFENLLSEIAKQKSEQVEIYAQNTDKVSR